MILIGLTGAKQCGKSSLAQMLVNEYGFERLRLADTMKQMLRTFGLTEAQVDGSEKEVPSALLCGRTPRFAMQTLGTEWGRQLIGEDLWVAATQHRILQRLGQVPEARIVVDDIRFPNEADMIMRMSGTLWRIRRPEVEPPVTFWGGLKVFSGRAGHVSEQHWRVLPCHVEVMNDDDLGAFLFKARCMLPEKVRNGS